MTIDLTPPAFLLRPKPDRSKPLPAFVLADRNGGKRDWAPIRSYSPEAVMARIDALIVNRDAPVTVWARDVQRAHFENYAAFVDWYRPSIGRFIGANSQATFTDIALDTYVPPPTKRAAAPSKPEKPGRRSLVPKAKGFTPPTETAAPANPNAKFIREGVTVSIDGAAPVPYRSARQAFTLLALPANQCQSFRKALKAARALPFVHGGKTYNFVVV